MITFTDLEVRAGVRTLLTVPGSLVVHEGDRIGLVGRNGAGTVSYTHLTLPTICSV